MKILNFRTDGLITVFLLLLAGCTTQPSTHNAAPSTANAAPTPPPSLALTPPASPTLRPTWPPTITPYPTLEAEEMRAFVQEMLGSNGGCELPCWWGIVPGETGWEEMQAALRTWGIGMGEDGHLDLGYVDPQNGYRITVLDVEFHQQDGLVQSIRIANDYYYDSIRDDFAVVWQRYSLARILSQYGVPSQVYLILTVGAPCIGSGIVPTYEMWVVYDSLGMAVLYSGMLIQDLDRWYLCPAFGQTSEVFGPTRLIEIRLQSPVLDEPTVRVEPGDEPFVIAGTLTELARMSMQEFYESFSSPAPSTCAVIADPEPWYDDLVRSPDSASMAAEEEDAFLVDMLTKNGNCELPCWWGITPGVTSWQDAQEAFLSWGRDIGIWQHHASYFTQEGGYVEYQTGTAHEVSLFGRHAQYPFDYVVEHTFYEQGDRVELLSVVGHALGGDSWYTSGWSAPQYFAQDWHRYTLDQVLNRLGLPSEVMLHYWPYEGALYSIALLYEEQGVLISYMGSVQGRDEGNTYRLDPVIICPVSNQITDINILIRSADLQVSLADIFNNWRLGRGYYSLPFSELRSPSLEEATGMSLEDFYTTYLDSDTQACIEARAELGDDFP